MEDAGLNTRLGLWQRVRHLRVQSPGGVLKLRSKQRAMDGQRRTHSALTSRPKKGTIAFTTSTREMLPEETKHQPEPMLCERLHYLSFLACRRKEELWPDALPTHEVEPEGCDIPDSHEPT
jgi:hypothetical protein